MQFFAPRKRQSDGRWDYTRENSHGVFSIGYCAGWIEHSEEDFNFLGKDFIDLAVRDQDERRRLQEKYHLDGHVSAAAAVRCYRIYVLDTSLKLNIKLCDTQKKCVSCGAWTDGVAELDHFTRYYLCDTHRVRAVVENLYLDSRG